VQFDHRMLAYAIFVIALLHALDVARAIKDRRARIGAFVLCAAVVLQMALGIATLVWVVPLWLGLLHQAGAMLVLTVASGHAAFLGRQQVNLPLIPAQAGIQPGSPLSRGRAG
jgi:cytochrome c oxidase assembly protein subunit 15